MEYRKIDKKIFLQRFQYTDIETSEEICAQSGEANYMAIKNIWNSDIEVYLIYKRF